MEFSASTILVCLTLAFAQSGLSAQSSQSFVALEQPDSVARNIWLEPELRDIILETYAASPTFRQLAQFLDREPNLHITVEIDPSLAADRVCRAQCEMRRYSSGLLMARIRLPSLLDAAELVAHELEHVREKVEGVNLAKAYIDHRPGVVRLRDGRFETQRAYDLGRRVKAEVERARPLLTTSRVTP